MKIISWLIFQALFIFEIYPACTSNTQCTRILKSKCSSGSCVSCSSGSDCTQIGSNSCNNFLGTKYCSVSCSSSTDAACKPSFSYCNTNLRLCSECSNNGHCSALYGSGAVCSSNQCVQCTQTSTCTGGKVCKNTVCTTCSSNVDCLSTAPKCTSPSNLCGACTVDTDCANFPALPRCASTGACAQCNTNSHCSGSTPICSSSKTCTACTEDTQCGSLKCRSGACVQCASNTDCTSPNVCLPGNVCGPCTINSQCLSPTTYCQSGVCVQCRSISDCASTHYCQTSTYTCVLRQCNTNSDCTNILPVCNTTNYSCQKCTVNSNCPTSFPKCFTNGSCVNCLANSDCSGFTPICSTDKRCRACSGNSDCTSSYCNTTGNCVSCLTNANCAANKICKATTYTCGTCLINADCFNSYVCLATNGLCYECISNSNCPSSKYCGPNRTCLMKECQANSECPISKPKCNFTDFKCTDCTLDTDCPSAFPYCAVNGSCSDVPNDILCTNALDCPIRLPFCDGTKCQLCSANTECPTDRPNCLVGLCYNCISNDNCTLPNICQNMINTCGPCSYDSECPINLPLCYLGKCYECVTSNDCNSSQYCDPFDNVCMNKLCFTKNDCSTIAPVCDSIFFNCTDCIDQSSCPPNLPICSNNGSCIECYNNNDCPLSRPICGGDSICHQCNNDGECYPDYCNIYGYCVNCLSAQNCSANELCLMPNYICGTCRFHSDCPSPLRFCIGSTCINCRDNTDCLSSEFCHPLTKNCTVKACLTSANCDRFGPVCDTTFYNCTSCRSNLDCSSPFSICLSNGSCVECISNSDCFNSPINLFCHNNTCMPCQDDTDCGLIVCHPQTQICVNPQCSNSSDCSSFLSSKCSGRLCLPCQQNSDCAHLFPKTACESGTCVMPVCNKTTAPVWRGNSCANCLTDLDCGQFVRETLCNSSAVCVNCTNYSDCPSSIPICRSQDFYCAVCNKSSECAATNSSKNFCHSSGKCVGCLMNPDCTNLSLSSCNQTNLECEGCNFDSDCSHFTTKETNFNCVNKTCISCSKYCTKCSSSQNCLVCESPYTVILGECGINCLPGFGLLSNGSCGEICGDGQKRLDYPFCDDGNTKSGDGCSSSCQVEDGWLCEDGNKYQPDKCRLYPTFTISQSSTDSQKIILKFNQKMTFPTNLSSLIQLDLSGYLASDYSVNFETLDNINIIISIIPSKKIFNPVLNITVNSLNLYKGASNLTMITYPGGTALNSINYIPTSQLKAVKQIGSTAQAATTAAMAMTAPSFVAGANPAILFAVINLLQMFYYLLYINTDYPLNVQSFLSIFSIGTLDFFPNPLEIMSPGITADSLPAPQRFLNLGISGYFLSDQGGLVFIWGLLIFFYVLAALAAKYLRALPGILKRIFYVLINGFEWSWILNAWIASYLNLSIAGLLQLRVLTFDSLPHSYSSITGILVIGLNIFCLFWSYKSIKKYRLYPKFLKSKYAPLVEDLKEDYEFSIFFNVFVLAKRFLSAVVYVFCQSVPYFQVLLLGGLNMISMMVIFSIKPQRLTRNYVFSLMTEVVFFIIHVTVFVVVYDNAQNVIPDEYRFWIGWIIIGGCCTLLGTSVVILIMEQIEMIKIFGLKFWKLIQKETNKKKNRKANYGKKKRKRVKNFDL